MLNQKQFVYVCCVKNNVKVEKTFLCANRINPIPGTVTGPYVFTVHGKSTVTVVLSHGMQTLASSALLCPVQGTASAWNLNCPDSFIIGDSLLLTMINWFMYGCGLFTDTPHYVDMLYEVGTGMRLLSGLAIRDECVITDDIMSKLVSFVNRVKYLHHNGELRPNTKFIHTSGAFEIAESFMDIGEEDMPIVDTEDEFEDEVTSEITVCVKDDSVVTGVKTSIEEITIPITPCASMQVVDVLKNKVKTVVLHSYVDVVNYFNTCHSEIIDDLLDKNVKCTIVEHFNCFEFYLSGKRSMHYKVFGHLSTFTKYLTVLNLFLHVDTTHRAAKRFSSSKAFIAGDLQYGYYLVNEAWKRRSDDHMMSIPLRRSKTVPSSEFCGILPIASHRTSFIEQQYNKFTIFNDESCYLPMSRRDKDKSFSVWAPNYLIPKLEMVDLASYKTPAVFFETDWGITLNVDVSPKYHQQRHAKYKVTDFYKEFIYPLECEQFFSQVDGTPYSKHHRYRLWKSYSSKPNYSLFKLIYGYDYRDPYFDVGEDDSDGEVDFWLSGESSSVHEID